MDDDGNVAELVRLIREHKVRRASDKGFDETDLQVRIVATQKKIDDDIDRIFKDIND